MKKDKPIIIIAHHGLDRNITEDECLEALKLSINDNYIFVNFEAGNSKLEELYELAFDNLALSQKRKFAEILKPILDKHPDSKIAYFGLTPIPVAFHLGVLVGNVHSCDIYQFHHKLSRWLAEADKPSFDYQFNIQSVDLPKEIQKGKGDVVIRIATSFAIDKQATYEVVPDPENEFDIALENPNVDSLYTQENIHRITENFQNVLDTYASKLTGRDKIHLFMASSSGLPFALGRLINPNIYPYIQTYQFSRGESPQYAEAILVTKESENKVILTGEEKIKAKDIRLQWSQQLHNTLKPFIKQITGKKTENWFQTICDDAEYATISIHLKHPWNSVPDISKTSLAYDKIDLDVTNVDDGFEYIEKNNSWYIDDGFLSGLNKRLLTKHDTDIMQAARLFFFHEALHYSNDGHKLTREVANGIGQFPKVIEEADYQADVWGLLTEYKFCTIYQSDKLSLGLKNFFCNAIETAVETMWSFVDNGSQLNMIQVRSMNRFLNWYWQWLKIESLRGTGTLEDIIKILLDKPVIEFAGAPMDLRGYRTYYKLNSKNFGAYQLAAFDKNKVYRFAPNLIQDVVDGFRNLDGEKIKSGLKSYLVNLS